MQLLGRTPRPVTRQPLEQARAVRTHLQPDCEVGVGGPVRCGPRRGLRQRPGVLLARRSEVGLLLLRRCRRRSGCCQLWGRSWRRSNRWRRCMATVSSRQVLIPLALGSCSHNLNTHDMSALWCAFHPKFPCDLLNQASPPHHTPHKAPHARTCLAQKPGRPVPGKAPQQLHVTRHAAVRRTQQQRLD